MHSRRPTSSEQHVYDFMAMTVMACDSKNNLGDASDVCCCHRWALSICTRCGIEDVVTASSGFLVIRGLLTLASGDATSTPGIAAFSRRKSYTTYHVNFAPSLW